MKSVLFCSIVLMLSCNPNNNKSATEFVAKEFVSSDASILKYNILDPAVGDEKLPLLIFLHGAGERGDDNKSQLVHIAPILTDSVNSQAHKAILVFPQCPEEDYWANVNRDAGIWTVSSEGSVTPAMNRVIELIRELRGNKNVDLSRVYIAGLSMGGFGTLDLLARNPDWFAAGIAICGGGDLNKTDMYAGKPLWIFHGAKDPVVPVDLSRSLVDKIHSEHGFAMYKEYPEGGHNIWNQAFEDPKTLPWLFSQKL